MVGRSVVGAVFLLCALWPLQTAADTDSIGGDDFPVGVWLQSPRNAPEFSTIGIHLFVGLWNGPTEDQLSDLARNGMRTVAAQNDVALASPHRGVIAAWLQQPDEPDNAQRNDAGGYDPCIPAAQVAALGRSLKAKDPSRPVAINFGQGVADPSWVGRGSKCFGDLSYYAIAAGGADILSFDVFPVAASNPARQGKLEYVARGIDRLAKLARPGQTVWAVIETTHISSDYIVTPEQLRDEVWMAIVHGAGGIVYFVHEWKGGFREDGIFRYPKIVATAAAINRTIASLAPVLHAPDVTGRVRTSDPAISIMVKAKDGYLYIFASSASSVTVNAAFAIAGIANTAAAVIDEDRTVAVTGGVLTDSFAPYAPHIYKVALQAR